MSKRRAYRYGAWLVVVCGTLPALFLAGCRGARITRPVPERDHPPAVIDYVPTHRALDRRPFEFIWADRRADQDAWVDFEGLIGWRVVMQGEGQAHLERSQDQQLFDHYVGKVTWRNLGTNTSFRVIPPQPLLITDRFDTCTLWLYGGDSADVSLLLLDASEREWTLSFDRIEWTGWGLSHKTLADETMARMDFPLRLTGLLVSPVESLENGLFYLDQLSAYTTRLRPVRLPPRPRRGVDLFPGQLAGLNTGEDRLPFPVSDDYPYGLPTDSIQNRLRKDAGGFFEFTAQAGEDKTQFRVGHGAAPHSVEILWNHQPAGVAFAGLTVHASSVRTHGPPVVERHSPQDLYQEYADGHSYTWRLRDQSLLVDVNARGGWASGVVYNGVMATGSFSSTSYDLPFLPAPVYALIGTTNMFVYQSLDAYRSSASFWDSAAGLATYAPSTQGRRNDVFERLYVNAATRLSDVLPPIPHPPSTFRGQLVDRLWLHADQAGSWTQEFARLHLLYEAGLSSVWYGMNEQVWREDSGSRSLRVRANPFRGGDRTLGAFASILRDAGWKLAMYVEMREISPLNAHWSDDAVVRASDGSMVSHERPAFALRPTQAWQWTQDFMDSLIARHKPDAFWLPGFIARPPWAFTDFDARLPGVGTFSHVFYSDGEWLLDQGKRLNGPVILSSEQAWFYAGLADGFVVSEPLWERSWMPVYKWMALHSLSVFFGAGPFPTDRSDSAMDRYFATQIAYGTAGCIPNLQEEDRVDVSIRAYYVMKALQSRMLASQPDRLLFWDGLQYHSAGEALLAGTSLREQLYLQFPCDLEVWINGSSGEQWAVRLGMDPYILPESGWLAAGPGLLAFSGLHNGQRLDYVESPAYTYFDSRGEKVSFRGIRAAGPLIRWPREQADVWLNPTGLTNFSFETAVAPARVEAQTRSGSPAENVTWRHEDGWFYIEGPSEAFRFLFYPEQVNDIITPL